MNKKDKPFTKAEPKELILNGKKVFAYEYFSIIRERAEIVKILDYFCTRTCLEGQHPCRHCEIGVIKKELGK